MKSRLLALVAAALTAAAAGAAVPENVYSDLRWRLLGPFRAGWALVGAGVPGDPATFYFGGADGGVWKTTDAGVTWRPLERAGSGSIGALALAPSDPRTIWVGTGQIHQRYDIVSGDGVYRSTDAGETWSHLGLSATKHIGAIWVDPRRSDVALVAALGPVFGPSEERGVFRTEDGGKTFTKVLFRDRDTGAAHLACDPASPDVVYASLWQVRRYPWLDYFQPAAGPGSGIHRSTDGGRTWSAAGTAGLPAGPMGRIALAVASGTGARRVFAAIDAREGRGLYRSEDGGTTWTKLNDEALSGSYMAGLTPDPGNPDVLFSMGRSMKRSTDGGKTFQIVKGSPGGDDYHHLWIDPTDPRRMITSADQGAVVTLNGGASWSSWYNQPTGQLYRVAADDRFPYRVYAGQQDNGTVSLATRSDYGQLTFRDWHPVGGDERDADIPDPNDPDIVYGAGLGGRLSRWNARTGQVQNVAPWPVTEYGRRPSAVRYRWAWITPFAIAPRAPHALYMGAQVVFRSTDSGRTWATISKDLTGAVDGAKGCEGDVPVERATACGYGVIFTIAPSRAADGHVWVGTDNGRVQRTTDSGATWTDVTPPGMRDWTRVNTIDTVGGDPGTAYVAADRHRLDDPSPLGWKTHDGGATWTEIGNGLPRDEWLGVLRRDPARNGLLYAGTSKGVHVSFDDGATWQRLQLNLPQTGINDLIVHSEDLVIATQGRALWALDGVGPLRHAVDAARAAGPFLAPPSKAVRLRASQNKDTPLPPEEPRAANPPVGAVLDYVLPATPKTPVVLEIADAGGRVLRRFSSGEKPPRPAAEVYFADLWLGEPALPTARAGHNRFVWDLRLPAPRALERDYSIAAVPGGTALALPAGAFVQPGQYEVRLTVDGATLRAPLEVVNDPRSKATPADLEALFTFQGEVEAALARSAALSEAKASWEKAADARRKKVAAASAELAKLAAKGDEPTAINGRLTGLATDLESADEAPSEPQRQLLAAAREELDRFEAAFTRISKVR